MTESRTAPTTWAELQAIGTIDLFKGGHAARQAVALIDELTSQLAEVREFIATDLYACLTCDERLRDGHRPSCPTKDKADQFADPDSRDRGVHK